MESLYCRIYGRVQMVMFRDFTTRKARSLTLVGYVRNLSDGSVEAYAQGNKNSLERWMNYLDRGSLLSRVDKVEVEWNKEPPADIPQKSFDSFEIVF